MSLAPEPASAPPPPSKPKELISYLVFALHEDGRSWTPINIFKARTAQKAIEAALENTGGEKGTFAATPESKFTVKKPTVTTQTKIVWE